MSLLGNCVDYLKEATPENAEALISEVLRYASRFKPRVVRVGDRIAVELKTKRDVYEAIPFVWFLTDAGGKILIPSKNMRRRLYAVINLMYYEYNRVVVSIIDEIVSDGFPRVKPELKSVFDKPYAKLVKNTEMYWLRPYYFSAYFKDFVQAYRKVFTDFLTYGGESHLLNALANSYFYVMYTPIETVKWEMLEKTDLHEKIDVSSYPTLSELVR